MMTTQQTQVTNQPSGDIVARTVPELRSSLRELLANGVRQLVIDLTNVQMVDSAGLGLLISTHNSLKKVGGQLSVIEASPDVMELLTTMRMHLHFSINGQ